MKAVRVRILLAVLLLAAISGAGAMPGWSDTETGPADHPDAAGTRSKQDRARTSRRQAPLSYRSSGSLHKLLIPASDAQLERELISSGKAVRSRRYGRYTLLEIADDALSSIDSSILEKSQLRDDFNLIMLKRGQLDTTGAQPAIPEALRQPEDLPVSLNIVQLFGPPTAESVARLKESGAKIVSYIPNNAYLVWATRAELSRLGAANRSDLLQWSGPFHPAYKIDPLIKVDSVEQIPASIEIIDSQGSREAVEKIKTVAREVLMPEFKAAGTIHIKVLAESFRLAELARLPQVLAVEPWVKPELKDERANQIVAAPLAFDNNSPVGRPSTPGYLDYLASIGLNTPFDFSVDVADTGFDTGAKQEGQIHPDFLDPKGKSRISFLHDFSGDFDSHSGDPSILPAHDTLGHGTLNASIVGGFSNQAGSAFADSLGYQYGLGVAPFVKVGISKLFDDNSNFARFSFEEFASTSYRNGARISSNSWGACNALFGFCNLYSDDSRIFDSLVRDARPEEAGNQSYIIVVSAGNEGNLFEGTINMPGTAKNVITVGASEGFRPEPTSPADACETPPVVADNAMDIAIFSSSGRTQDGRAKPDLVAPGTNIVGAAPQDPFYRTKEVEELGVCNRFFPAGQTLYTMTSGTSHSAPIVSGAAALAYQWLKIRSGVAPSPALVKALILNSTTYLTGQLAGDNLPGKHQGWGLLNIRRMFDATDRIVLDESPERTFTQSGGQPFEVTGVITDASKEFRVMLTWTDPPGSTTTNAPYVNQLNLEVVVGGVVYQANNFSGQYSTPGGAVDFLNNVQGVRINPGTTGPFVVRVKPVIIAGDAVPGNSTEADQDFALVVTNGRQMPLPVLVVEESDGSAQGVTVHHQDGATDSSLIPGETASVTVAVKNLSQSIGAESLSARLVQAGAASNQSDYPAIGAGSSAANLVPFQVTVPSSARCGSLIELQLSLDTPAGVVLLPVRVRAGRLAATGGQRVLLEDDVDSGRVKWKLKKGFSVATGTGTSGAKSYRAVDQGLPFDNELLSTMTLKKKLNIPANAGNIRLSFFHIYHLDVGFDGGVAEISTDGGLSWQDLGSRVIVGGYDGKVSGAHSSANPLGDRLAWTSHGRAGIFTPVVINLDEFAGQRIQLRFLAGFDQGTGVNEGFLGWFIDDIRLTANLYECP